MDQNAALVQLAERFGDASVGSELVIPNRFFALYIWGSPNSYQLIMTNKVCRGASRGTHSRVAERTRLFPVREYSGKY